MALAPRGPLLIVEDRHVHAVPAFVGLSGNAGLSPAHLHTSTGRQTPTGVPRSPKVRAALVDHHSSEVPVALRRSSVTCPRPFIPMSKWPGSRQANSKVPAFVKRQWTFALLFVATRFALG